MFRSLQTQIFIALIGLVTIVCYQAYATYDSQQILAQDQLRSNHSNTTVEIVRELERDVLDLQRNVLIFKETASDSSIAKFSDLMARVNKNLSLLESEQIFDLDSTEIIESDLIGAMRDHLKAYEENFSSVIESLALRRQLVEDVLSNEFFQIFNFLESENKDLIKISQAELFRLEYHLSRAQKEVYQYLLSPESETVKRFKDEIAYSLSAIAEDEQLRTELYGSTQLIKRSFSKLVQVTRGYVFLVNVVMTGSANEFFFLTKKLREQVLVRQQQLNMKILKNSLKVQDEVKIVAVISMALTLFIAFFLVERIIRPVRALTKVFHKLAKEISVLRIPEMHRHDEIGQLAQAANVFRNKNIQTSELLESTQKMYEYQEGLNRDLEKAKIKAEAATVLKSMFLANMSHEIRTPMNGIIGLVNLLLNGEINDKQKNYLNKIAYSGEIMMGVINDVLDFSKIEAGKLEIEETKFCMNSVIENIISAIYLKVNEKALNVRFSLSDNFPSTLLGDPLRINQVLLNLCNNAVKFTESGLISLDISYQEAADQYGGLLTVLVSDTGIGLSKEAQEDIFDSFTQADGTTSRKFGGTGLGLSIVKQLVGLMGGTVSVESQEGKGSQFQVSFKVKAASKNNIFEFSCADMTKVYYVSADKNYLLEDHYLKAINLNVIKISYEDFFALDLEPHNTDIVLMDVASIACAKTYAESLKPLTKKDFRLGFILDMQPNNLKDYLSVNIPAPILSHPFSPKRLESFLSSMCHIEDLPTLEAEEVGDLSCRQFVGHVLLVEDNAINQLVAGDMLEDSGLTFDLAENGLEAVDRVNQGIHYDLVFMDIQMPVMDGYEATKAIRKDGYDSLVICGLSANAMKMDVDKAMGIGMNEYLTKPIEPDMLDNILEKYLKVR